MIDYTANWLEYRRLRNELVLFVLTSAPLFFLLVLMSVRRDHAWFWNGLAEILNLLWTVALVIIYLRLRRWRCPRCGKRFYSHCERRGLWLLTNHCWHCELIKYSDGTVQDLAESRG
jgi:hypothetical protein